MKRRDFLKYLSSLPFIGSLFARGESGASEGKSELPIGPLAQFRKEVNGASEWQPDGCLAGENDILRDLPIYPADNPIGNHRGIGAKKYKWLHLEIKNVTP